MSNDDPFEDLLNLEEKFYQEGYKQGQEEGVLAGRIEGRQLGLEKGFQKFMESGRLYGRAIVWANRLLTPSSHSPEPTTETSTSEIPEGIGLQDQLPGLPHNPRLEKHITTLYALVETESLSTENTDDAVNDFADRLKRAHGKAKIIEKLVGEGSTAGSSSKTQASPGPSKVEV